MTVKQLIKMLESLKDELKDCEVVVVQPNGLLTTPEIKFMLKNPKDGIVEITKKTVKYIVLS